MKNLSILILVSIFTISCNSKKHTSEIPTQNINRIWMLVEFKDYKKDFLVEKKAFLDMKDNAIATSKMGCNNLSFHYKIKNSNIEFNNGITTEMACLDMKLEDDFLKSITTMSLFSIDAHILTLISKEGQKMVFVAQDWD
jgi:heat shock protein HslJ